MLVRPCGETASGVDDAENRVGADEVPGKDRSAACGGITRKALGINGGDATVGETGSGSAPVELGLIDVNAFFVLSGSAGRNGEGGAGACGYTVAGCFGGCVERAVIGYVVV